MRCERRCEPGRRFQRRASMHVHSPSRAHRPIHIGKVRSTGRAHSPCASSKTSRPRNRTRRAGGGCIGSGRRGGQTSWAFGLLLPWRQNRRRRTVGAGGWHLRPHLRERGSMALIKCVECSAEVSDKAAACPKCGCPNASAATWAETPCIPPPTQGKNGGWLKWVLGVPAVLFGLVMCGFGSDPDDKWANERLQRHRQECWEALMSSIGHGTGGYADKAASDAKVRDKCDGLSLSGQAIGK